MLPPGYGRQVTHDGKSVPDRGNRDGKPRVFAGRTHPGGDGHHPLVCETVASPRPRPLGFPHGFHSLRGV